MVPTPAALVILDYIILSRRVQGLADENARNVDMIYSYDDSCHDYNRRDDFCSGSFPENIFKL